MAKESGLGFAVTVDDSAGVARIISTDVTNLAFATPRGIQDVTGVDRSAMERLHLLADFSCTLSGVFDDALNAAHDVFKNLANARTTTLAISGQTLTNEALYSDYSLTRGTDGSFTWSAPGVLSSGVVPVWT